MALLEVSNLAVSYKGVKAVSGVSFSLEAGEILVVMGPSGAGKSTLLKAIPRLVEPSGGSIVFDGVEVTTLGLRELRAVRARMGYLPQNYGLFPHLTVLDNAALPLRLVKRLGKEEARRRAFRYLEALGIAHLAHRYPAQLSGGQQQRAALARALAMEPSLLLLDEPTSALDPESRASVIDALYRIVEMKKSMIIVTHEVDFALKVGNRIAFMEQGRIFAIGEPREVIGRSERLKRFLDEIRGACGGM